MAHQPTSDRYRTGMRAPALLLICLLFLVASVASGCGSTKKPRTTGAASTSVGTSAPAKVGIVPKGPSTKASQHTKTAGEPSSTEAKAGQGQTATEAQEIQRQRRQREADVRAAHTQILGAAEADVPPNRRYPKELQGRFLRACKAAKGSTSSCECIIARQEGNLKVERGQSLAELLALEIAFEREHASLADIRRRRVRSPRLVRRVVRECA
jgi:hypothetical protein